MKQLMEKVLNELIDHKAEGDLLFSSSRSLKMSAQKGAIAEYKVSGSQILGIRAIKDNKVGIAFSEATDEDSLKLMVRQALDNAENGQPNEHERILPLSGEILDHTTYPETPTDITVKTQLALDLEGKMKERDKRVTAVPYNSFSESEYEAKYLSSRGRFTSFKDKTYSITSSALMEENGKKSSYYDYQTVHSFQELTPSKVIDTALFHATNILTEKPLVTGKYPVVFDEDSLKSLLDCFSNLFSAKATLDKLNPWGEKLGAQVAASALTITDEPSFPSAFRRSLFDSEGVEQKSLTLIENGVLRNFYHNSVTASKSGVKTTGHASRGPGSSLGISGTCLVIKAKNIFPLPERYLEVIQMDGLYSGANRVTGTFSVAVKGYVWEKGERVMTFGNCTLSGNLLELLKRAEGFGTDLRASTDLSFFSVPLVFHDLSIAGANS